jgi:hypothetical protein
MKTSEDKKNSNKIQLSNIKGMLNRDEMKKVTGGYIVCYINGSMKFCTAVMFDCAMQPYGSCH